MYTIMVKVSKIFLPEVQNGYSQLEVQNYENGFVGKPMGNIWTSAVSRCGSRAGKVLPAQRGPTFSYCR
eukprot:UN27679